MASTTGGRKGSVTTLRVTMPHAVPGRLRVKVQGRQSEVSGVLAAVRENAGGRPGIRSVTVETRTGSALVVFDPEQLDLQSAVTLVQNAHQALAGVLPPSPESETEHEVSAVSATLTTALGRADRTVMRATHGVVDLRMTVPIGLAGLGARQLIRYGPRIRTIPWYSLAYYAFDTFIKLRKAPTPAGRQPPVTAGAAR